MPHVMIRALSFALSTCALAVMAGQAAVAQSSPPPSGSREPRFEDYPATDQFEGVPAAPIFDSAEQRTYRTRIRRGVQFGEDVWLGSWKNPIKTTKPNFAGHYFVIRWGCGSNCLMMAVVDAKTGKITNSPLSGRGTGLYVNMDMLGDREIEFRPQSTLMVLRNACRIAGSECGVYYFNLESNGFRLLKRTLVDLTREP